MIISTRSGLEGTIRRLGKNSVGRGIKATDRRERNGVWGINPLVKGE